jgi:hypothetical protein
MDKELTDYHERFVDEYLKDLCDFECVINSKSRQRRSKPLRPSGHGVRRAAVVNTVFKDTLVLLHQTFIALP